MPRPMEVLPEAKSSHTKPQSHQDAITEIGRSAFGRIGLSALCGQEQGQMEAEERADRNDQCLEDQQCQALPWVDDLDFDHANYE